MLMKYTLRAEELTQLALTIAGLYAQPIHIPAWLWPILFLAPDLGMLGYLINTRVGAFTYNVCHHKGLAILLIVAGYWLMLPMLMLAGLLLYAHSAFDRMMGYGLKYGDSFKHTHLGWLPGGEKVSND